MESNESVHPLRRNLSQKQWAIVLGGILVVILETVIITMSGMSRSPTPTSIPSSPRSIENLSEIMDAQGGMFRLKSPFRMIVAGPSSCGKTTFTKNLALYSTYMIKPPPTEILWHYKQWQDWYRDYSPRIKFIQGLPRIKNINCGNGYLFDLDDFFLEVNKDVVDIFTCKSHHQNISVVFITQNLFHKNPHQRTVSLNASYMVLFKNPRDQAQIRHLAQQMYPSNINFLVDAFRQATTNPYSYLFVDLTQEADDKTRLRTDIFPGERTAVFVPSQR